MGLGEIVKDRWQKLKDRLKDAARLPLVVFLIFTSGIFSWLGIWFIWRLGEYLYHNFLSKSWVP
jgi:hypothetical protein